MQRIYAHSATIVLAFLAGLVVAYSCAGGENGPSPGDPESPAATSFTSYTVVSGAGALSSTGHRARIVAGSPGAFGTAAGGSYRVQLLPRFAR